MQKFLVKRKTYSMFIISHDSLRWVFSWQDFGSRHSPCKKLQKLPQLQVGSTSVKGQANQRLCKNIFKSGKPVGREFLVLGALFWRGVGYEGSNHVDIKVSKEEAGEGTLKQPLPP